MLIISPSMMSAGAALWISFRELTSPLTRSFGIVAFGVRGKEGEDGGFCKHLAAHSSSVVAGSRELRQWAGFAQGEVQFGSEEGSEWLASLREERLDLWWRAAAQRFAYSVERAPNHHSSDQHEDLWRGQMIVLRLFKVVVTHFSESFGGGVNCSIGRVWDWARVFMPKHFLFGAGQSWGMQCVGDRNLQVVRPIRVEDLCIRYKREEWGGGEGEGEIKVRVAVGEAISKESAGTYRG